jgi:hypothetical protein
MQSFVAFSHITFLIYAQAVNHALGLVPNFPRDFIFSPAGVESKKRIYGLRRMPTGRIRETMIIQLIPE